jgi:hypothetical protein
MNLFLEYKSAVIVASFILGSVIAVFFYHRSHSSVAWKVADLVSVLLGGIGALVALMAASYNDERGRIDRQVDISYAITKSFEASANRFLLLYCDKDRQGPPYRAAVVVVCKKTIALATSAKANGELPLFLDVVQTRPPLSSVGLLLGGQNKAADAEGMSKTSAMTMVENFDAAELQTIAVIEYTTRTALSTLSASAHADISVDYQVLAGTYSDLIKQLGRVKAEWDYLEENSIVLILQVVALCLIAFAAPFQVGKAIDDFNN